jgi:ribonuclease R
MGRKNSKKRERKDKHKHKHTHEQTLKGVLDVSRSGTGFVVVENMPVDIMVRPGDFGTALHGDTVRVKVKEAKDDRKRQRGIVTEVLHRKQSEFIGKLEMNKGFAFFIRDTDKPMPDIYIPPSGFNGAKDRDRVVVRITEWGKEGKRPVGEVVNVLNKEDENDMAMKEILLQYGFPLQFPDDALEEEKKRCKKCSYVHH